MMGITESLVIIMFVIVLVTAGRIVRHLNQPDDPDKQREKYKRKERD
jgi:hypothetical protein